MNLTDASWILELVILAPLSLVLVLLDSLTIIVREKKQKDIETLDFIFFYPSIAAYCLGTLWLIAPIGLIGFGMRHFFTERHLAFQKWVAVLAAAAILTLVCVIWDRVRYIRKKTLGAIPEDDVAADLEGSN